MNARSYLPSTQFIVILVSLLLAGGLVYAAEKLTTRPSAQIGSISGTEVSQNTDWQSALSAIQAQNSSTSVPTPVNPNAVNQALQEVKTSNLTETVGKTVLINLTNAKSQGLGDDIPTQNQITADAIQQLKNQPHQLYSQADLTVIDDSDSSKKVYANKFILILQSHPQANTDSVLLAVGRATDNNNSAELRSLPVIQKEYAKLTNDLLALPVPRSFVPFHILIVNDFKGMADSVGQMQNVLTDPLLGATSVQQFSTLASEESVAFTNVAQQLQKDGILFSKTDPGSAWNLFLSPS